MRGAKLLLGIVLGLVAFWAARGLALSVEAQRLAGILVCTAWWWVTEALPLPVAGLLGSCACVVFTVAPAKQVLSPYADPVIFLFIGSFWIAEAMSVHGLDRRLAVRLLSIRAINASPARLVLGLGLLAAGISLWISNTATTAMLLPIVLGILRQLPEETRSRKLETNLLLMLSFAASVGGLGTPVGTPPNLIGIGMLERIAGIHVSFFNWCRMALPITAAAWLFLALMLARGLGQPKGWEALQAYLGKARRSLGPWSRGEQNTALAFGVAVGLWLFASARIPEGIAALLAAGLLFMLPSDRERMTMTWQEAARVDWGTIFLFGSGMSLGQLLFETKLAETVGTLAVTALHLHSPISIIALVVGLALITSELASNTASAGIAVPLAIAVSRSAGISSTGPALAATLGSSFGFLLPVSTPPNALVYGTGRVPLRKMVSYGLCLDLFGFVLVWLAFAWR